MRFKEYMSEVVSKGYRYQLTIPAIKKLKPVRSPPNSGTMLMVNKPDTGFWTSTLKGNNSSDWVEWIEDEDYDTGTGTVLKVKTGVKMYIIDNKENFQSLLKSFPFEYMNSIFINFKKFAKTYDALYVTKKGVKENKMLAGLSSLIAWDAESTVWFNTSKLEIVKDIEI